ncbi:MAG: uroporphyrinogen decarboxylase family protein [Armatimonadota bacterium]|nr:uroporphyrinogen decarboxylase family protein [Armatimonadota bacterium]
MPVELTRRQRALRCFRWQPFDRVPIYPPIPFDPGRWERGELQPWQEHENYRVVAELVERYCQLEGRHRAAGGLFSRAYALIPAEHIERASVEQVGERTIITTLVHTPKGDLRTVTARDREVTTAWMVEPLIKSEADVEALLSVPFEPNLPDPEPFAAERRAWGERGLVELGVSTPLVCASHTMPFELFLEWTASKRPVVERLIATIFERIHVRLEHLLESGAIECIWMGGSEQATPPMMSYDFYEDLVVPYDGRLIELAKSHGALVHIHCHGKVNDVLDLMMAMGADMTDPVEPPPDGDVHFADAKRRCRRRMVLMGNIEFRHMEQCSTGEIDELVRRAICEGGKSGVMLYPSATPITWMSDQLRDNCLQYIQSGLKYGEM